jgi:hypothetical protein
VDNILNCILEESAAIRDRSGTLINDRYNLRTLKQKQIDCNALTLAIELLFIQLNAAYGSLDVIDGYSDQIMSSSIKFTEYFLTEITPQEIRQKYDRCNTTLTTLQRDVKSLADQYDENLNHALQFVQQWNSLAHWIDNSHALLDSSHTKVMDDIKMVQHAIELYKMWHQEFTNKTKPHYTQLCETAEAYNAAKTRNDSGDHFVKDALDMYGLVSLEMQQKRWLEMDNHSKKRIESLTREEKVRLDCLQVFKLSKNVIDVTFWTFAHFAKNNRTISDPNIIQLAQVNLVERALGEELDLGLTGDTVPFTEFMLALSDKVIQVISTESEMKRAFQMFETLLGKLNWEKIVSLLGSSLTIEDMKYLYTILRYVEGGIDYSRLARDIFE